MPQKHILLMYITQSSGHHSAALSIEEALKILDPQVKTTNINAFHYTNPVSEKIINRLYMNVIQKAPQVWDYLYDNPQVLKKVKKIRETIHRLNSPKLRNLFEETRPDAIVCTQAFPCGMVADFKAHSEFNLPLVAALTDYVPHSYWIYEKVDYYISPSDEVTGRLITKGVRADKIKTFGIPFNPNFNNDIPKQEALEKLNLSPDAATLLIMGGGQGLGPVKTIIESLEKSSHRPQEIVVTGTNTGLYNSLKKNINKYKNKILLLGYADNINELMSAADIIITKPGGITTAEALGKKIPMVIINPLPGQEANNTAYLTGKNAAVKIDKAENLNLVIDELLDNPKKLNSLRQAAASISKPNASMDIARLLLSL